MSVVKVKRRHALYAVLFLFILIFAPPFLPKTNLILAIYSIGMIAIRYKNQVMRVLTQSEQWKWIVVWLFLFVYAILIFVVNLLLFNEMVQLSHYVSLFNRYFVLIVTVVPCLLYYLSYAQEHKISFNDTFRYFIYAALIQCVLVFASFMIDPVHDFFMIFFKKFSDNVLYDNTWYTTIRSFGFASTLVDVFGLGMGILAGFSLIYGILKKRIYIFFSLLIACAGMLNARTTLLIYAISVFIAVVYLFSKIRLKLTIQVAVAILISVLCVKMLIPILKETNYATYDWIIKGVESIEEMLRGGSTSGSLSTLFSEGFWTFPDNAFQILFGTGHSVYLATGYSHSDVGYVNELWFIGIVGMTMLYGFVTWLFIRCYLKADNSLMRMCSIFLLLAFYLFNVKGGVIGYNPGGAVIFSFVFILFYYANKRKTEIAGEEREGYARE